MKIIGLGYPCMDMNILCPAIPKEEQLVKLLDVSLMGGGKVANAIVAAARLGAETGFVGVVGEDRYGKLCIEDLKEHRVDISKLDVRPGHTTLCLSIVDEENRGKHYIESPATANKLEPQDLDEEYLRTADYLMLFQMDETAIEAARIVSEAGGKDVVDGDEPDERTQANLSKIDILIASEYYYRSLFENENYEENLRELSNNGPQIVIVTLGSRGSVGIEKGKFFQTKPYQVQVKDTTGAGDAFHGAFVYGISCGMSAEESALFASAVSAIKCTVLGGRTGLPTLECVQNYIQTGKIIEYDFDKRNEKYRNDMWV